MLQQCKSRGRIRAILPRALTESLAVDDRRFRAAYGEGWARDALAAVTACGAAYKVLAA